MKYKKFQDFILESLRSQQLRVYSTFSSPLTRLAPVARWFSLNEDEAKMYHQLSLRESDIAYTYEFKINAKIANFIDTEEIADDNDIDYYDFVADMVSNPSANEVKNNQMVKILQKMGYEGVYLSDYHPENPQKDITTLMLFDAKKSTISFRLKFEN